MGDYYPHFLSSMMAGAGGLGGTSPQEFNYPFMPGASMPVNVVPGGYQNFGYFQGYADTTNINGSKPQKYRRKSTGGSTSGAEQTKHRRTRSGCFMCRSRRVKCDETRPICERCRKGDRECNYPDSQPSKSNSKQKGAASSTGSGQSPPSSSNEDIDQDGQSSKLETIPDEDGDDTGYGSTPPLISPGVGSFASENFQSSAKADKSVVKLLSPMAIAIANRSAAASKTAPDNQLLESLGLNVSNFPLDYQIHLQYFAAHVSNYHYSLTAEFGEPFMRLLLSEAVKSELLLNAVIAFSAYLSTVRNPEGKLKDFLQYYNRSVTLLLDALKRKETHNVPTLLTILQLATIEEYLGDWVNLMGHQKAAFEILSSIFTPQTVMETVVGRICRSWFARNDVIIALLGGFQTDLTRDWFTCAVSHYQEQSRRQPDELQWKIQDRSARVYLTSYDMSVVYSQAVNEKISDTEYAQEHKRIIDELLEWKQSWDPALTDPAYLAEDNSWKRPLDDKDIVNPYEPNLLYKEPLFCNTLIDTEWHALMLLHISQAKNAPQETLGPQLQKHGYAICQYFEALEYWPETPTGTIMLLQQAITLAILFLPQDERHHMWLRRKQALIETMGYIHPSSRRSKLAGVFKDPSAERWWLPNDEGFTEILQCVRNFADERSTMVINSRQKDLKEVRILFTNRE